MNEIFKMIAIPRRTPDRGGVKPLPAPKEGVITKSSIIMEFRKAMVSGFHTMQIEGGHIDVTSVPTPGGYARWTATLVANDGTVISSLAGSLDDISRTAHRNMVHHFTGKEVSIPMRKVRLR